MARRLYASGNTRLLVVGGTPAQHAELRALVTPEGVELRCVDGKAGSHSLKDALPNLRWASVIVIWGSTPLPHTVSEVYTRNVPPGIRVVKLARRGAEALCLEVLRELP